MAARVEIPQIANSDDRSVHRFVIQEIKSLASTEDREISFTLCRRSQNKVSHALAAYGRSTPEPQCGCTRG